MPTRVSKQNFTKNSLRIFNDAEISKLWSYVDGVRKEVAREEEQARSEKEKEKAGAVATPSPAAGKDSVAVEGETRRRKPKKGMDLKGHVLSRGFTSNSISVRAVGDFAPQETKITPTQTLHSKTIVGSTAPWLETLHTLVYTVPIATLVRRTVISKCPILLKPSTT